MESMKIMQMQRIFLFCLTVLSTLASQFGYAEENKSYGKFDLAVKIDYVNFDDEVWAHGDVDDSFYFGLEGYARITQNLYLGGEVGYINSEELTDVVIGYAVGHNRQLTLIPIEINLKHEIEVAPDFFLNVGVGVSYIYAKPREELFLYFYETAYEDEDWLWGGQFFVDLKYKFKRFFIGLNWKYQITQEFKIDTARSAQLFGSIPPAIESVIRETMGIDLPVFNQFDFDSFRAGLQIGLIF